MNIFISNISIRSDMWISRLFTFFSIEIVFTFKYLSIFFFAFQCYWVSTSTVSKQSCPIVIWEQNSKRGRKLYQCIYTDSFLHLLLFCSQITSDMIVSATVDLPITLKSKTKLFTKTRRYNIYCVIKHVRQICQSICPRKQNS